MHYTLMHKEIPVVDIELDDASGARALRHRIQSAVEDPLAGLMLADSTLTAASVSVERGAIAVRPGASK